MRDNPLLMTDGYKTGHHLMYPEITETVYSNFTCRSIKRMPNNAQDIVVFGIQYTFIYINELWQKNFFNKPKHEVCGEAKKYLSKYLGTDYDVSHFEELHDLGYLPIKVKALEEGTIIQAGIPLFTIVNTNKRFYWLTNFLETLISTLIWKPVHSASLAYAYKKVLLKYAKETDKDNLWFVDFQGHDFSFRGMQSPEAAISSGLGFAAIFKGSDTIPVLKAADYYYNADESIYSVNATEHSVMCAGSKDSEIDTFRRLLNKFPKGILSVVSDTWDLWKVCTEYLPILKDEILARDGKLVIRPDSGDPVDIICGIPIPIFESQEEASANLSDDIMESQVHGEREYDSLPSIIKIGSKFYKPKENIEWNRYDKQYYFIENVEFTFIELECPTSAKGVIELLWDVFGGTINEQGYKVLDSHIGAIYGDSITLERAEQICERLKAKGFASTNVVLGIGSYSMGYATRDNQGGAVKSTYIEIDGEPIEIFKNPITDDGTKKSAKGLLSVIRTENRYELKDQCTHLEEEQGELKVVYLNGVFGNTQTLEKIRERINNEL